LKTFWQFHEALRRDRLKQTSIRAGLRPDTQ
jgi:hypothetical protein